MALERIKIDKLFGQFDYDIALNSDGVTILTGPNGYGKTTILNIVYNLFRQNFFFFQKLKFEMVEFQFSHETQIIITKKRRTQIIITRKQQTDTIERSRIIDGKKNRIRETQIFYDINLSLKIKGEKEGEFVFDRNMEKILIGKIFDKYSQLPQIRLYISQNLNFFSKADLEKLLEQLPENTLRIIQEDKKENNSISKILEILELNSVYLIKEQRLIKPLEIVNFTNSVGNQPSFSYTIEEYAKDLKDKIITNQVNAFQKIQKLDSSFLTRLINQKVKELSDDEFKQRLEKLKEKQNRLQKYDITIGKLEIPEYNKDNARVLSTYLDNSERKTLFFDELVNKIDFFVTALNQKELSFKTIKIDSKEGFSFISDDQEKIEIMKLSSGEQQEVILLYELLFKTDPNTLILVDEPEISLHVTWQKEFVKDLFEIIKIQNISFLLATHSPQIVNHRWDLVVDLYQNVNGVKDYDDGR